jgi:Protein of unknown function (DUF1501)
MQRREFLGWVGNGLSSAALASLMLADGTLRRARGDALAAPTPHFVPRARRAIHICLCGAMSHVDTFDYKPDLIRLHGKSLVADERPDVFFGQVGLLRAPDWRFAQHGESGLWISELFPHLAGVADELTVINSMFAETSNHTPAIFQQNTGFRLNGFPALGAWLSYGLGAETDDLPAFVVIPDARELPAGGSINWSNGFLSARHQGVMIRAKGTPIDDLFPAGALDSAADAASLDLAARMNARHLEARSAASGAGADPLAARVAAYEMAARMQTAVPEVADLERETAETHALYGLDRTESADFGRACLLARRMLERGSPRRNWDGHEDMRQNHNQEALRVDQPVAGLLKDLRRRGLLDDTLVLFTTEFGRTPFTQAAADSVGTGRDHNQYGFTVWLAGAGLKHGLAYGATDEVGYRAVDRRVAWHDFHATVLHLLGIDHERLTFYHNGIQRRLTNVHGEVLSDLLA